jgi:hypothetical protein
MVATCEYAPLHKEQHSDWDVESVNLSCQQKVIVHLRANHLAMSEKVAAH